MSVRLILTVVAAAITLVLDAITPLGLAVWLFQVVLVWITSLWANARQIIAVAVVCAICIVLGFWFSPRTGLLLWVDVSNLLLGLGATAAIAHIGALRRTAEDARRKTEEVASQAEVARCHLELKSMLLESLAHEFQTPLTSIRAGIAVMLAEVPRP